VGILGRSRRTPDDLRLAALDALIERTGNVDTITWLGKPIWQNPLDAWMMQQAICDDDVDLVVECGTNRGGSAYYMASIFDLLGRGHVITIDVATYHDLDHDRVDFLLGSSTDPAIVDDVFARVASRAPEQVMVVLDSDHSAAHVRQELELYSELIKPGGYVMVQDGCVDELDRFADLRPGPLVALEEFVRAHPEFEVDEDRSSALLFCHSPRGWLRRVR
jgi:cephalosporin hydroxylase